MGLLYSTQLMFLTIFFLSSSIQLWSAYVPCGAQHLDAVQLTLEQIDVIRRLTEKYSHALEWVTDSRGELNSLSLFSISYARVLYSIYTSPTCTVVSFHSFT